MFVQIKVDRSLKDFIDPSFKSKDCIELDIGSDATIEECLSILGIKNPKEVVTLVNGRIKHRETTLEDGDEIQIYPLLIGG